MTNDSAIVTIGQIGDISQISGMLAIGGDVVVGNKTVIQHIVQQAARELIVHPYKFLSAYDISDKDIFFGRDALTKQLAGKVSRHKILLLNGAPGSGKSSLINAGLIPYLAENGYTYLSFRDYSDPLQQLQNCLIDSGILSVANSHPEFLAHTLIALRNSKLQMVFVFDQFERFFVHVPPAARIQFIEMIKICMETLPSTEMNVVFAIREKFFGQFQREFEELIHAFLNECERVNIAPLSKSEARQAIVNPLTLTETKIGYDDEFVDNILLVGLEAEIIEKGISPSHLQIVCNQLYQAACQQLEHKHFVVIDHKLYEQLGGTQTILRTYLDDCINTVANHEIAHIQLLRSLLKQMIETVGIRKFVPVQQLYFNLPDVPPSQIDRFLLQLQDARVIEMRSQEMSYSLSHEFMVAKVQDWFDAREMERKRAAETLEHGLNEWKNSETLLTEKQIKRIRDAQITLNAEEQEFLRVSEAECDKQRRKEEEQIRQIDLGRDAHQKALSSKRKIMQVGVVVTLILIVIAIEFAIDSYHKFKQAQKTESLLLADLSRQTLEKGDATTAMLLALEALPKNMASPDRPYVAEAEHSLYAALSHPYKELVLSHEGWLNSARFSADGKKVVTASGDNTAQIWEVATGKRLAILQGHEDSVRYAEFSLDGQMVVTASRDNTVKIWKVTGELLETLHHNDFVNHAQFSSDNQKIITTSEDRTAKIWTVTGKLLATLQHNGAVIWIKFDRDEQKVVTASHDHTAKIWEVVTGKLLATLNHASIVNSAEFSPDGRLVVTASHDHVAKIWEVETGKLSTTLRHEDVVNYAEFSPDGQMVITASNDNTAKLWNISNEEPIATLSGHGSAVTHAKFSSNGQLVTISFDNTVRLWNTSTRQLLSTFHGHEGLNYAEFNRDGDKVVTASLDKTARIWERNIDNQKLLNTPKNPRSIIILQGHEGRINSVNFSPKGHQILSTSEDKTARIWNTEKGELQTQLSGHTAGIKHAEFNASGDKVVTASTDKTVRLWDLKDQSVQPKPFPIFSHEMAVEHATFAFFKKQWVISRTGNSTILWDTDNERTIFKLDSVLELSADEQKLLIISDNIVNIFSINFMFNPKNTQPIRILPHLSKVNFAQFSNDGKRVITGSGNTVQIWNITDSSAPISLPHGVPVCHAAFSSDGRKVISAASHAAFLWDADSGDRFITLPHTNPVIHTKFSLDGQKIVTVSEDNKIRVWEISLSTQELIDEAKRFKPRDLTIEQREQYSLPVPDSMRQAQEKIMEGRKSANQGNLGEAQQAFAEAQKLDNTLRFDPAVKAKILTANYALNRGKQFAEEGNSEAAIEEFAKLAKLNPNFTLDPKLKTRDILIDTGKSLLIRKQLNEAIAMVKRAQQIDPNLKITVDFSNSLCWYDSVKHGRISEYCNQ